MITLHSSAQARFRGIPDRLVQLAEYHASKYSSAAIQLSHSDSKIRCDDGSNGNELWAIARGYTLVTMFYRRSSQSKEPDAFGVREVKLLA